MNMMEAGSNKNKKKAFYDDLKVVANAWLTYDEYDKKNGSPLSEMRKLLKLKMCFNIFFSIMFIAFADFYVASELFELTFVLVLSIVSFFVNMASSRVIQEHDVVVDMIQADFDCDLQLHIGSIGSANHMQFYLVLLSSIGNVLLNVSKSN